MTINVPGFTDYQEHKEGFVVELLLDRFECRSKLFRCRLFEFTVVLRLHWRQW